MTLLNITGVLSGGEDYGQNGVRDPQTFTAVVPASSSRGTMPIVIIEDTVVESNETFTLTITQLPQACNIASGQNSTDVTIVDNDGKVTELLY